MMTADFSLDACMDSVKTYVEVFHKNPFEELGRAIIRAEQDVFFNKTMITAWKKYIADNGLTWKREVA